VKARKLSLCALMTALALVLSYLESLLQLSFLIPVPGLKLGLSNLVTLTVLVLYGLPYALPVAFAKCFLGAFFANGPMSFWFSFTGALCAIFVMWVLLRYGKRVVSLWGVSMAGAAMHNLGQILAAAVSMQTAAVFGYLPVLLLASIVTGTVIAAAAAPMVRALSKTT